MDRGIFLEICYSPAIKGMVAPEMLQLLSRTIHFFSHADITARRNTLANAMELVDVSRRKVRECVQCDTVVHGRIPLSEYHCFKPSYEGISHLPSL